MASPLKITEADVGRILYVEASDLVDDVCTPISPETVINTAAVVVRNEDDGRLGVVFLTDPWLPPAGLGVYPKLSVRLVVDLNLYATQADALKAGLAVERGYHDQFGRRLDEIERLLTPDDA